MASAGVVHGISPEIFGVIAEHLILQNAFGSCASLHVANKPIHFHLKPVFWKVVFVKCDRKAALLKPDPNVTKILKAGNRHIQYVTYRIALSTTVEMFFADISLSSASIWA
jgi:hypothetical protein